MRHYKFDFPLSFPLWLLAFLNIQVAFSYLLGKYKSANFLGFHLGYLLQVLSIVNTIAHRSLLFGAAYSVLLLASKRDLECHFRTDAYDGLYIPSHLIAFSQTVLELVLIYALPLINVELMTSMLQVLTTLGVNQKLSRQ